MHSQNKKDVEDKTASVGGLFDSDGGILIRFLFTLELTDVARHIRIGRKCKSYG